MNKSLLRRLHDPCLLDDVLHDPCLLDDVLHDPCLLDDVLHDPCLLDDVLHDPCLLDDVIDYFNTSVYYKLDTYMMLSFYSLLVLTLLLDP
uniref:Uncharacterized protein n=1 Tax=viral metagenome TaxID=1070528 RepID=A0A6C0BL23_9ZZZZ